MDFKQKYAPKIPFEPYLILPIKEKFQITEGFIYSLQERKIHGNFFHNAIDYSSEYGTPIYAAASGYAVSGYHRFIVRNSDKTFKLHKGLPSGNGFGYFVQIYHPEEICKVKGGRITQYGHLSKISDKIILKEMGPKPYDYISKVKEFYFYASKRKPISKKLIQRKVRETEKIMNEFPWVRNIYGYKLSHNLEECETYFYKFEEIENLYKQKSPYIKWVEQGEIIGYMGVSAIITGNPTYKEGKNGVEVKQFETWDEVHLHFEEAKRDPENRLKKDQRDPYNLYKSVKWYKEENIRKTLFK